VVTLAPPWTSRLRFALRAWQGALVIALIGLAAHDIGGLGHPRGNVVFDRWLYEAIEFAAALGCLVRATRVRAERGAWLAIGLALLSTTIGDVLYDFAYGGSPPYPSAADAFYLAFYPLCYVGIGLLLRARVSRFSASLWLDGLMAGLAAAAVGASVLLPVVVGSTHGHPLVVATNLAYPLGDIVLLSVLVFVFAVHGWRPGRAWALIAAGLLLNAVGDGIYLYQTATGTYVEGTYLDLCWPTSLALIAVAAWHSTTRSRQRGGLEQRTLLGTPVVCGLIGVGVLVAADWTRVHPVAVTLAAATVVLVLGRTALTFRENLALLARSRTESLTDALTGLGNRRKLVADLGALLDEAPSDGSRLLVIFDLNGFKDYNDSFGHPAGDALLARLGGKLSAAVAPDGAAYRLGGDEFCILIPASETLLDQAALALLEQGESFDVSSAFGGVLLPDEAQDTSTALGIADERLYAHKEQQPTRRGSAHELLLRTLAEREPGLREHVAGVASLAVEVARRLGIAGNELDELRLAAELHDVGKLAIPDAVLLKPGVLDEQEWSFIRQHTLIGQRILAPAAALTNVGRIVRSTHEDWDGNGYPDGLAGEQIPLAARVIAACDAFVTITSDRPYRAARSKAEAIRELRRCSGTQFEPAIVDALYAVIVERAADGPASAAAALA
jgi:diguanylate cyclase (GGDEF)-like protein